MAITEQTTQKRAPAPNQETDHYNPTKQNGNVSDNNDNNNNKTIIIQYYLYCNFSKQLFSTAHHNNIFIYNLIT